VNLGFDLGLVLERRASGGQREKPQRPIHAERQHRDRQRAGRVLSPGGLFKGVEHDEVAAMLPRGCDFGRTSR